MPSRHFSENQSKSHFQIAVSTYYALRTRSWKKATTSTTTTFCVPSRFQFSAWLPFSSPSRPTFQVLKYYLGFGNCLLSAEQEKFPKFSSCSSTFLKTCAVTAKKYLILYSMESTWSQDKLPRGHNFRRNGNDSIEWPSPYKVHNLVKSLTFPSTTSNSSSALHAFILFIK